MIPQKVQDMVNSFDRELVDLAVSVIKEMEPQENWIDVLKDCTYYRTDLDPKTGEISIEEIPSGFSGPTGSSGVSGWSGPSGTFTYPPSGTTTSAPTFTSSTTNTTTFAYPYTGRVSTRERAEYLKEIYNYYFKTKKDGQKSTGNEPKGSADEEES
jgi:hypothetical protein